MAACLVVHGSASALDERGEVALKELLKVMREEVDAGKGKEGSAEGSQLRMMSFIEKSSKNPGSDRNALEQHLDSIENLFTQPGVKRAATKLLEEIRREETEVEDARIARAEALVERVKQAVRTAKEPSDLDSILMDLEERRRLDNSAQQSPKLQELGSLLVSARNFTASWQDYLSARESHDIAAAREVLENLKSERAMFIPRSEILSLEANLPSEVSRVAKIVMEIKSLDDVRPAIIKLNQGTNSRGIGQTAEVINALLGIDKNYQQYKEGFPPTLRFTFQGRSYDPPEIETKFLQLQAEFYKLIAPSYVGAPKEMVAREDETVTAFLERLEEYGKQQENFGLRLKLSDLRRIMTGNDYVSQDNSGIAAYNAGKNQEIAGQYELAVVSYQQALRSGSELVPVRAIGERLAALKAGYPEEFRAGIERFMDPPPSRYGSHPYGGNPSYYHQLGRAQTPQSGHPAPAKKETPVQEVSPGSVPPKEPAKAPPGN
jgi:hypothetical protein